MACYREWVYELNQAVKLAEYSLERNKRLDRLQPEADRQPDPGRRGSERQTDGSQGWAGGLLDLAEGGGLVEGCVGAAERNQETPAQRG